MDLYFDRQLELRGTPKGLAKDLPLDFELTLVAGVLVMTAAASAEVAAPRLDARRRRLNDRIGARTSKAGFLLGKGRFDVFTGEDKRHKHSLAAATFVGGHAAKAIPAVNQLFDRELQDVILNRSVTGLDRRLRRRPMPTEN